MSTEKCSGFPEAAMGWDSEVYARGSVGIGERNLVTAAAPGAVALGMLNKVEKDYAVGIGVGNQLKGYGSVAMGYWNETTTDGQMSLAVGYQNKARGNSSVALGNLNQADGWGSVAIGKDNWAKTAGSLAMGWGAEADGLGAVAAGWYSKANTHYSTALGYFTTADGLASTAIGSGTIASTPNQLVVGSYNQPDYTYDVAFIIGNGFTTTNSATPPVTTITRQNALMVKWNGDVEAEGKMKPKLGVETPMAGGVIVTGTLKAVNGKVLVPLSGDISMGEFGAGEQP